MLTPDFWRSRRAAAVAGIIFGVLLMVALIMVRVALSAASPQALQTDGERRALIRFSLNLVPFAGIAFLWFIGVVRDQISAIEDRLFSTVFLGSGLLFLAMLFLGAVTSASLLTVLAQSNVPLELWAYGRTSTQVLISVYAMRMAAVFTLSVSTLSLRTAALPRWVSVVGFGVALVLLVAAGEHKWSQLVFPAWVLMVSLVILFTRPLARPRGTEDGLAPGDQARHASTE